MVTAQFSVGQWVYRKLDGKAGLIEFIAHMVDDSPYVEDRQTKEELEIVIYAVTWEDGIIDELVREDELG